MTLSERRKVFYRENRSLCEEGCKYIGYNIEEQLVNCQCKIKIKPIHKIEIIDFNFKNDNLTSFFNVKTYASIACLKCYKLLFTKTGFVYNIGNFLLLFLILLFIIIMIIFCIKHKSDILNLISHVTKKNEKSKNYNSKNNAIHNNRINVKFNSNSFNLSLKKDSISDSNKKFYKDILSINDKRIEKSENSFNKKNTN